HTTRVDVRIIAATNSDLTRMVADGQFREDLYYRLKVIEAVVPPLRERRDEIPLLTDFFIAKYSQRYNRPVRPISDELRQRFLQYNWPGNIRELENMIERAIVLCEGDRLDASLFPINERRAPRAGAVGGLTIPPAGAITLDDALERIERTMIEDALEKTGGVKTRTAELLGIKTSALYYKLEKYGLTGGQAS
ncbi:MAG TPA: helix-turn-helix domain-containing protein, partial [Gemmatimonadota bacterium]|nr:helix-turn-helix domain-containing protein [Gemmatimonadota bacterium]